MSHRIIYQISIVRKLGSDDIGPRKTVAFKPSLHVGIGCQRHGKRLKSKIRLKKEVTQ